MTMLCNLCPRRCNALRDASQNIGGVCQMPSVPKVARAALHFWEEPSISGKNGSGTVFFSGCSLHCVFCQNNDISALNNGKNVSIDGLAEIFKKLEEQGANNINLVTPTHYVDCIIEALNIYKPKIPIVYNSSGYENVETLKKLEGYVDIYLMDFKYIDGAKAKLYSNASDYPNMCKNALKEVYRQQTECVFENEIMKKGVIVRHLLMPQATRDAIEIFEWVRENLPNAYFSMMSQYLPYGRAEDFADINRKITRREQEKVLSYILESGKDNVFVQEMDSSSEKYIPDFDLSGI